MQRSLYLFGDQGMPVIDEFMDIPVLDWCPAFDAVLWIMLKQPPVAFRHERSMGNAHITLGMQPDGKMVSGDPNYFPSWDKLYEVASQGKVGLRGRPAIGLQKIEVNSGVRPAWVSRHSAAGLQQIEFDCGAPPSAWVHCEKWGDFEAILPAKLEAAGVFAFSNVQQYHFLTDKPIFATEYCPETAWAYTGIEVNFLQLRRWFHPAEGKALRVGTKVKLIKPEAPAEAAVTRHAGGRPRIWDLDGATNAARAAMSAGKFKKRSDVSAYVEAWFKVIYKGRCPEQSQISKVARRIWSPIAGNREN
jgi:hypothetical protein